MNTVLMGGSEETKSCTSADDDEVDDVRRCCDNSTSCDVKEEGTPNMQWADPDDVSEWSGGKMQNLT